MSVKKLKNIEYLIFVTILLCVFFVSCNGRQKEQEESLVKQAKVILIDNESSNSNEVENTILSIKAFLSDFPDSKKYAELNGYIDDLYLCLDFHKVKDCQNNYHELSVKTYSDINSAILDFEKFLNQFTTDYGSQLLLRKPQLNSIIDEAKTIYDEFKTMKIFFERTFSDLVSYNLEVEDNTFLFENSSYETIRMSWKEITDNQRDIQAEIDMKNKVADFEKFLIIDAERICNYNFNDFEVDNYRNTQLISIGNPYQHDSFNAKVCEGVYRVYMKGAYLGLDKGTVKIAVKGMIVVTVDVNNKKSSVEYRNIDFQIQEKTGDL